MEFSFAHQIAPRTYGIPPIPQPNNFEIFQAVNWQVPVVVEVGCGTGMWSVQQAQINPNRQYFAFERTHEKFEKLKNQLHKTPIANLIAVQTDAIYALATQFPDHSVDLMTFFYPNPYPKMQQANLRFFVGSSLWVILKKIKVGGQMVLASNILKYVEEAKTFLTEFGKLGVSEIVCLNEQKDFIPRTRFEKKYFERGERLYELRAQLD